MTAPQLPRPRRRHRSHTHNDKHWRTSLQNTRAALGAVLAASDPGAVTSGAAAPAPAPAPVGVLWEHQRQGVAFMAERLARPLVCPQSGARVAGGLLGDDTRLGKTWTTLAFWYADWSRSAGGHGGRRPSLVVCPKLGLSVWGEALRAYLGPALWARVRVLEVTPDAALPAAAATTAARRFYAADLRLDYDLVLTTYSALTSMHRLGAHEALTQADYRFVFCDEAHGAVNEHTAVHGTLAALRADAKWFITATPIQNTDGDLRAALELIGVPPADTASPAQCVALVRALMLRRTKDMVAETMGLNPEVLRFTARDPLPRTVMAFATDVERRLYAHMALGVSARFAAAAAAATAGAAGGAGRGDYTLLRPSAAIQAINDLRQLCVQPLLPLAVAGQASSALPAAPPWLIVAAPGGAPSSSEALDADERTARAVAWRAARLFALGGAGARDAYAASVRADMMAAGRYSDAAWAALAARVDALVDTQILPPVTSKERAVCHLLTHSVDPAGEKLIVFSNWQQSIESLHALLTERAGLLGTSGGARLPVRMNGATPRDERDQTLRRFATDARVGYLLVTMKTGATAVDMSVANHVVLLDPWWNPHVEYQAIERIMGHGQRAARVHVYRYVLQHTIEEAVADLADEKLALSARYLEQGPAAPTAAAGDDEHLAAQRLLASLARAPQR